MLWEDLTTEEQSEILEALDPVCRRAPRVAAFIVATIERLGIVPPPPRPELSHTVDEFLRRWWPPGKRRGIA